MDWFSREDKKSQKAMESFFDEKRKSENVQKIIPKPTTPKKKTNIEIWIGDRVVDNKTGKRGTIAGFSSGYVRVEFNDKTRKSYDYPGAFLRGELG